jgi:N-acetylneuraminic acid mutarotase
MFGGFTGGSTVINEMWQYNDTTDTWTQMTSAPGPGRNNPAFLIINNKIYIGLGADNSAATTYSDFYFFNPDSNTYTQMAGIPLGRSCAANFTLGNTGYIGLGITSLNAYQNDFYTFNPTANAWTQIDTFGGIPRAHVFNEVVNGIPYVGCGDYASGLYKSDNWSYGFPAGIHDIANNSNLSCYPSPASGGFTIDMSGYSSGDKQISISDQLGRIVYQTNSSQDKVEITNKLSLGIYVVSVDQNVRHDYTRIVVE